ncbi:tail fiber protein [Yersinia phage fHe-Yen9-02]|nr:tail fiber protein [Yersinia phage fHe-Yen9-02]
MSGLIKIDPRMLAPGLAPTGNVLGKTSTDSVGFMAYEEAASIPGANSLTFDPTTGTLTLIFTDGSQASADGLPTADMLKKGREGKQGQQGLGGKAGVDGRDGRDGDIGCPGPKGERGRQGNTGDTGPIGATGNTGDVGPTGSTGPTGAPGRDAIIDDYAASQVLDPLTGEIVPNAFIGSNRDKNTGFTINMGRQVAPKTQDTVHVIFNTPFINRCVGLNITFLNAGVNQAKTYALYNLDGSSATSENFLLGGFTLKSTGQNVVDWDFFFTAEGD